MKYYRQNTAAVHVIGPFIDKTDGAALEDALNVTSILVRIMQPLDVATIPADRVTNGAFTTDVSWTKGTGWDINSTTAAKAHKATGSESDLEQAASVALVENVAYEVTFTVAARSAGGVTPKVGGTAGTLREADGTFTETIIAGSGTQITLTGNATFVGDCDDFIIKQSTIDFSPTASGGTNDMVLCQDTTGSYWLEVTANQHGIVGKHRLTASFAAEALIAWEDYTVLEEAIYDALYSSGASAFDANGRIDVGAFLGTAVAAATASGEIAANLTEVLGDPQSATDLKDFADDGYDPATNSVEQVKVNDDMVGTNGAFLAANAPTNFSDLSITVSTGLINITQTAADKIWGTTTRILTASTNFNDLSAAQVNAEADAAIETYGLDHLLAASVAGADITDDSIIAQLVSKEITADWDDFTNTTDSLQALRARGDAAWTTGAGGTPPTTLQTTTIAGLVSQVEFNLTAGSADDGAYEGAMAVVEDASTSTQKAVGLIKTYAGATKTVILDADPAVFVMVNGDTINIVATSRALPEFRPDAAGGLPVSDAGGLDMDVLTTRASSTALATAQSDLDIITDDAGDGVVLGAAGIDLIYNEDIVAAHGTADTAGFLLRVLGAQLSSETRDATLLAQFRRIIAVVESQRSAHTYQPAGNILYVDPANGASHASGARGGIDDPYALVQDAHDNAVTSGNHDLIFLCTGAAPGVTTLTEAVTLSKRYLSIRGPGRDFVWTRSGAGDTIAITADGVSLSGFQLETAGVGAGAGIQLTDADFMGVDHVWINATQGDGINILRGTNCAIKNNHFTDSGQGGSGQGVDISGSGGNSDFNVIRDNIFIDTAGDAIKISGGITTDTHIFGNHIEGSSGWGINIGASSTEAFIVDNRLGNNTSGNITDAGTDTVNENNEQVAKHSVATEARLAELDGANLPTDIAAIPTTAMRGTDNAALASVATETRLAELDAGNLPTDIAAIPTTAMRGTDNAALASVATEGRLAELDAGNLPTDIAAIPTTAMRGTDSAALASVVTEARMSELDAGTGGKMANVVDLIKTAVDAIKVVTDKFRFAVANLVDSNTLRINSVAAAAAQLAKSSATIVSGTVDTATNSHTPTTTEFQAANITEATDDHFNGRVIFFTSGNLQDQAKDITDYVNVGGIAQFTVTAFTEAPVATDTFIIV